MKDFRNMSEAELKNILTFTNALADRIEQEKQINYADMQTTDESLLEAERSAKAFAERRKANLTARSDYASSETEQAEYDEVRQGIRDYYRRTRKIVRG